MGSLVETGLDKFIIKWIEEDKPYFGICLGLQVLFSLSEEGKASGLGLVDGKVKRFRLNSDLKILTWVGTRCIGMMIRMMMLCVELKMEINFTSYIAIMSAILEEM